MARIEKLNFSSTAVRVDREVEAAHMAESRANEALGASLQQRGKIQKMEEDQNFLNKARVDLTLKRDELHELYSTDSKKFNTEYDDYVSKNYAKVPGNIYDDFGLINYDNKVRVDYSIASKNREIKQEQDRTASAQSNQILIDDMDRSAESGNYLSATDNRDELKSYYKNLLDTGKIKAGAYLESINAIDDKFDLETNKGIINRFIADGDMEGLNEFITDLQDPTKKLSSFIGRGEGFSFDDGDRNVSEGTREGLLKLAVAQRKAHLVGAKAVNKVDKDNALETLAGYKDALNKGVKLTEEQLSQYNDFVDNLGDGVVSDDVRQFMEVNDFLNNPQVDSDGSPTTPFGDLPLRGMEERLKQMRADPKFAENKLLLDSATAMFETAKNADINYGVTRGWYTNNPLTFDSTLDEQLQQRKINQDIFNQNMGGGSDVSLFTDEEKKLIIKNLEGNPQMLLEFTQGLGGQAPSILAEVGVDNPILGVAGNLYLDNKLELGDSLFTGQTILDELPDEARQEITVVAQELISGAYGLNAEHEKAVRSAAMARAAYLAKLDGKPLNSDNFEDYYEKSLSQVAPPIVTLDSDAVDDYKITSPNPDWSPSEAQGKTEDWIKGLDATDFDGVEPALIEHILGGRDGGMLSLNDYGFEEYKLVPYKGGYLVRQTFPPKFVLNKDGTNFVLQYKDKGETVVKLPSIIPSAQASDQPVDLGIVTETSEHIQTIPNSDDLSEPKVTPNPQVDLPNLPTSRAREDTKTTAPTVSSQSSGPKRSDYPTGRRGTKEYKKARDRYNSPLD